MKFQGKWIPENDQFINFCIEATNKQDAFKFFKIDPEFIKVIGNDVREPHLANEWLSQIKVLDIEKYIDKFKTNDEQTFVPKFTFKNLGKLSTGTVYFIYILDKILQNFKDIKDFNICEIGSGYGGQAKIFLDYGVKSYTCIDIQPVLGLAEKYLSYYNYDNLEFFNTTNIPDRQYDLVISNWCLSEMNDEGIQFYLDNVVSKSKRAYFETNMWNAARYAKFMENLQKIFNTGDEYPELIKTSKFPNYTIVCWNQ